MSLIENYCIIISTQKISSIYKFILNPHMHKVGPGGPKHYIFGDKFYSKNARKLRFHVFLHFNARKHMISPFCLKCTKFARNCEFAPI